VKNHEKVGMVDTVEFIHRDKNGKIIKRYRSKRGLLNRILVALHIRPHNSMTNVGFAIVAGLIVADVGETAFDYMQIGTGITGATAGDHQLETPQGVRQLTTGSRVTTTQTNDTCQWVAVFSQAIDATLTGIDNITEVGIFNHVSADNKMLLRLVFSAETMDWDAGDSLEMTVKCQMKQGA